MLIRCMDKKEADTLMLQVHAGSQFAMVNNTMKAIMTVTIPQPTIVKPMVAMNPGSAIKGNTLAIIANHTNRNQTKGRRMKNRKKNASSETSPQSNTPSKNQISADPIITRRVMIYTPAGLTFPTDTECISSSFWGDI